MKNKSKFLFLGVLLPLSFSVAACDKSDFSGEHSWKETWSFDAEYHWKECNDCLDLGLRGKHISYGDACIVCGYSSNNPDQGNQPGDSGNTPGDNAGGDNGESGDNNQQNSPEQDPKWNLDFTKYGVSFRDTLASLIEDKVTKTTTYSACLSIGQAAAKNGDGKYTPFYHGSDYAVSTSSGSNREHTWPNSRGGGEKNGGANIEKDPFMVRPTITADNSDRANYFYGIGSNQWDPASCGFEAARGESARVIFYVATRYGKSNGLSLSNNPSDATSKKTMGTLKSLIEWNKKYPVTDMEIQVNEYLSAQGYGRNPFVDHPEYVDYIWDSEGYVSGVPSGNSGSNTGSSTGGSSSGSVGSYTLISALNDLDKASAYIVNYNTKFTAMTTTNYVGKGDKKYDWYFNGADATVSNDLNTMSSSGASAFLFIKQADGSFTIKTSDDKYLYSYIDGTHYSISIATQSGITNSGDIYWNITTSGKGYIIKGKTTEVYLQYNTSWCGKNTAPEKPIYLYK